MNIVRAILGHHHHDSDHHPTNDSHKQSRSSTKLLRLQSFGTNNTDGLYIANGISTDTIPYPTRMVVLSVPSSLKHTNRHNNNKQQQPDLILWNPIALDDTLQQDLQCLGNHVTTLIVPTTTSHPTLQHHHLLHDWQQAYPNATLYLSPAVAKNTKLVQALQKSSSSSSLLIQVLQPTQNQLLLPYEEVLDHIVLCHGEVVVVHKPTQTVMIADFIQRISPQYETDKQENDNDDEEEEDVDEPLIKPLTGWQVWWLKLNGVVGPTGGTPIHLQWWYWMTGHGHQGRQHVNYILYEWQPQQLILAHGECMKRNNDKDAVITSLTKSFQWLPTNPPPEGTKCGCIPPLFSNRPQEGLLVAPESTPKS